MAGKKWYYGFMDRNKNLSLWEPQATLLARAKGFNKENVAEIFDILKKLVDDNKIDATSIYNIDETGFSTVQNKCQKVLAQKGKRGVGSISSGERGVNIVGNVRKWIHKLRVVCEVAPTLYKLSPVRRKKFFNSLTDIPHIPRI